MFEMKQIQNRDLFALTQLLFDCPEEEEEAKFKEWTTCLKKGANPLTLSKVRWTRNREQIEKNRGVEEIPLHAFGMMMMAWNWKFLERGLSEILSVLNLGSQPDFSEGLDWVISPHLNFGEDASDGGRKEIRRWYKNGVSNSSHSKVLSAEDRLKKQEMSIWEALFKRERDYPRWDGENPNESIRSIFKILINHGVSEKGLSEGLTIALIGDCSNVQKYDSLKQLIQIVLEEVRPLPAYHEEFLKALCHLRASANNYLWDAMEIQPLFEQCSLAFMIPETQKIKVNSRL